MKKREEALVKSTLILALGNFLPKLTTLITLPILTQYLSKADYGTYDLILTIAFLLIPIATLKIDMGAFRFLLDYPKEEEEKKNIISSAVIFVLGMSTVTVAAVFIALKVYGIQTDLNLLICGYFFLDGLYALMLQIVRGLSMNYLYSAGAILYSVVNMILICVLVAGVQKGIYGIVIAMMTALLVTVIALSVRIKMWRYVSRKNCSKEYLKRMLGYSWPLVPNSLSTWVMNLSDRFVVVGVLGIEVNAVYAVANKIPNLFSSFQGTFVAAWQENASLAVKDDDIDQYYSRVFDSVFALLTGLMAGLIGFTPLLFKLLIRGDYPDAYYQMPLLFGGMICAALSSFLGGIYAAHKKTRSVGITTIAAAALNLVIDLLLIKHIGLYAASLSTFLSYLFLLVFRMIDVTKFQKMHYRYGKLLICACVLGVMCLISYKNNLYFNLINMLIGIAFSLIINYTIVRVLLNKLRNLFR